MPGSIKIDDGSGNYTILTNGGSLGSDKTITIPNTTGTVALTSDITSGLSSAQTFRLTAGIGGAVDAAITSNWEVPDTENQGNMGSLVSESSGIFTFSETGYYLIIAQGSTITNTAGNVTIEIHITDDNSTYTVVGEARTYNSNSNDSTFTHTIIDVTNVSNDKVKFFADVDQSNCELRGSSTQNLTCVSFLKLGAT
jgi:hypothetical protein